MPPLPKRKYAKARQGERRRHLRVEVPGLTSCPHCHEKIVPHRVCPFCGYYRGEQIIEPTKRGE